MKDGPLFAIKTTTVTVSSARRYHVISDVNIALQRETITNLKALYIILYFTLLLSCTDDHVYCVCCVF